MLHDELLHTSIFQFHNLNYTYVYTILNYLLDYYWDFHLCDL